MTVPKLPTDVAGGRASEQDRSRFRLPPGMTPGQARQLALFAVLGVIGALAFEYLLSHFIHIRPESVQRQVDRYGPLAPAVFIVSLATTVVVTPIPSLPLDIAAGLAFGLWRGTAYILLAALIGASVDFWVARRFGRRFLQRHLKPSTLHLIDDLAGRLGGRGLVVMRLEPLFNFKWVSYAAGLTSMSYRDYALATALGSILPAFGIAYVGFTLFTHPGRSAAVLALLSLSVVIPIIAGAVIAAGVVVVRRRRARS
ncbi:MAG: TVP38/TMEM64 family protein [Dehalococcoidia bacterium]